MKNFERFKAKNKKELTQISEIKSKQFILYHDFKRTFYNV